MFFLFSIHHMLQSLLSPACTDATQLLSRGKAIATQNKKMMVRMQFLSVSCEFWVMALFLDIPWLGIFLHH